MKRFTQIISDEPNKDLHSGRFGPFSSRKFGSIDDYDNRVEAILGKNLWAKLGSPHNIKVTLTVVD